jgi:DNA-binding IclR family transcriptional regulator
MSVQTLDRAFDMLELLSQQPDGLPLTEVASRLGLNKSTVHRILASLRKRGYVEQRAGSKSYRIGLEFIEIASLHLNNLELKTEAQDSLYKLSRLANQTVFMAIMQDRHVVYIEKIEAHQSLRRYKIIGQRRPLHTTSLGKALLSGLSEREIERLYGSGEFERLTANTIGDLATLLKEIELTKKRGWAFDDEENEEGTICVGAPVYDYRNMVIAAVSVAWERAANPSLDPKQVAALVVDATQEISRRMGYRWNRKD